MFSLVDDDRINCRGAGEDGQLGLRDLKDKHVVTVVDALSAVTIEGVVAGSRNSMAFSDEGQVSFEEDCNTSNG